MKKNLLFLCTGNSCRSQMAEGLGIFYLNSDFNVYSAGIETHGLNPYAVKVMNEINIDISNHRSKLLNELSDIKFDYVITVCSHANETCPVFPFKAKVIHKGFDDPPGIVKSQNIQEEEKILNIYRKVRDEIKEYIISLPSILN